MFNRKSLVSSGVALGLSVSAHASIVANFDDGTGTTLPDQFAGSAGDGWQGGWNSATTSNSVTASQSVVSTNPLNGGGNYLTQTLTVTSTPSGGGANQSRVGVSREFGDFGGVDVTDTVVFGFDFRVDDTQGFTNGFNDTIEFHNSTSGGTGSAGDNSNTAWQVQFQGNGNIRYRSASGAIDTGADWDEGSVYSFEIISYADTETYDLTILDDGSPLIDVDGISWRGQASLSNVQPTFLHIVPGILRSTDGANLDDFITVSLDNVSIAPIPEPGALALLAAGTLLVAGRRRR